MGLGRVGQVCSPLVIGMLLGFSWTPASIFAAMATAPLLAALCVVLYQTLSRGSVRVGAKPIPAE